MVHLSACHILREASKLLRLQHLFIILINREGGRRVVVRLLHRLGHGLVQQFLDFFFRRAVWMNQVCLLTLLKWLLLILELVEVQKVLFVVLDLLVFSHFILFSSIQFHAM